MRRFFAIVDILLFCFVSPLAAQASESKPDLFCEVQMHLDGASQSLLLVVLCDDPFLTQVQVLAYARSILDAVGFTAFTAIKSATPFGPVGPIDADTSPNWALEFFIPIEV